jgi:hypothetical protein
MSLFRKFAIGLRSLSRKNQVDRELDEELAAYLEMEAAEKMRQGLSRKDALREVRLERGSLEVTKELVRSGGWEFFVETCWQDLRFGRRRADTGLGHRCEHGHFQRPERHNPSPPPVQEP